MHASHLLTLVAASLFALTAASPTTLQARAEEKAVEEICGGFLLPTTPMCCNADADGEDGLDCKEASKIKDVKAFKKGCKKKQANCCATALGSGALVCQKVV